MTKRYVVTKYDLLELQRLSVVMGRNGTMEALKAMDAGQMKCLELEVPDWATHFAEVKVATDGRNGHWQVLNKSLEIPK